MKEDKLISGFDYVVGQAVKAVEMGYKDPHILVPDGKGGLSRVDITEEMMDVWKRVYCGDGIDLRKNVAANISRYRNKVLGITQREFAKRFGIKHSKLGAYEEGRAMPKIELLVKFSEAFGITLDELVKEIKF